MWLCSALIFSILGVSTCTLAPPEKTYNILMLLPMGSKSHRNVFVPLAQELANRGHKVVMVQNHPPSLNNPNIKEMYHGLYPGLLDNINPFTDLPMFKMLDVIPKMTHEFYELDEIKQLYERRMEFDVAIIDLFVCDFALPLAHGLPLIGLFTGGGIDPRNSAKMGNVVNPAYVTALQRYAPPPLGILDKLMNIFLHGLPYVMYDNYILRLMQKEISKIFPDLPPIHEIANNQSLLLMNSHFSLAAEVLPLLPNQVEVGAMHCREAKPLPEDILSWIEGAGENGVVYFSLGSVVKGKDLPDHHRASFIKAFARLKQRVIWKFEKDLPNKPDNVLISKWMPQQDILAHPNVRVFISHGGALGTQEARYHSTPVIITPVFADQSKNAQMFQHKGLGRALYWDNLSEDLIVETIQSIIANSTYFENMSKVSRLMKDTLETPVERAVFWTEYVIRNDGAKHLRSPAADLSWMQILMLDVVIVVLISTIATFTLMWYLVCARCCKRKSSLDKKKAD